MEDLFMTGNHGKSATDEDIRLINRITGIAVPEKKINPNQLDWFFRRMNQ